MKYKLKEYLQLRESELFHISVCFLILIVFISFILLPTHPVLALSAAQKQVIDSNSLYLDQDLCGSNSSSEPVQKGIYVVGDSLTVGMRDHGELENKLQSKNFDVLKIQGNNGFNITDSLPKLEEDASDIVNANVILVGLGTNPETDFAQKVPQLIESIKQKKAPNAKIYWINVHVQDGAEIDASFLGNERINQILNNKSGNLGFTVIDFDKAVKDNPDSFPFQEDGVHHTDMGYLGKADYISNSLAEDESSDNTSVEVCQCSGSGGAANLSVAMDFSLGSGDVERRVNFMKALISDYGLTPEQAAGPTGNFMAESGGADLPPDINEGGHKGPPAFHGGYGWAQWTGGRQHSFIDFSVASGFMASESVNATDAANYAYFKKELSEGYTSTIDELKLQSSPEDAAVSFEATFEKAGVKKLDVRSRNARQAYEEYLRGGGNASGSCGSGGSCVDDHCFPLLTTKSGVNNPEIFANGTTNRGDHPYIAFDIYADTDTEVAAFEAGVVNSISTDRCGGTLISIYNEAKDRTTSYMHLSASDHIEDGAEVTPGQRIAKVGTLANACDTVEHLHIDTIDGHTRLGCSREGCSASTKALFQDIGPQLYETFQRLPD